MKRYKTRIPPGTRWLRCAFFPDGKRRWSSMYVIWRSMRERCLCKTYRDYHYYGGRGITICEEWSNFAAFREWALSTGFRKGLTLDRIDADGNYEPANCRWATRRQQQETTRRTIKLTFRGKTLPLAVWARRLGFTPDQIRFRVQQQGWSAERALSTPINSPRRR